MTMTSLTGKSFDQADYGVTWALFQLPNPSVRGDRFYSDDSLIELVPLARAKGPDDYAIRFERKVIQVQANSAVGTIYGLLRLRDMLQAGRRKDLSQHLQFRTRNYKHEIRLDVRHPRSIVKYTDEAWEALCRQLVANQFNGLVFYPGYHPFEYFLEYGEFSKYIHHSADERAAVRKALSRGLGIAHRYGLRTFMQHYVSHFPQALAQDLKIPMIMRLADVDHPEIDRYCRYCYRETFSQLADLDGLYFNFESTGSNWQHVLRTAIPEFNRMKRKPLAVYRLWSFVDVEGMATLIKKYKGHSSVVHKVADTNDVYYLPVADSRIREWKKALGKDVEWSYEVGPCHNCGTNLCDTLWGDYDFVQSLLADTMAKGADSVSFHTVNEFFAPDMADPEAAFPQHEKDMAAFNALHLQAAVDTFNGRSAKPAERAAMLARRVGAPEKAGPALMKAIEASSQLILLSYQQFCYGSSCDGYLLRGRYSHIQDPFIYYPATELNHQAQRWGGGRGEWVDKTADAKVAPDNFLQYIIDYVDPAKPTATRNPQKIADLIKQYADESFKALAQFRKLAGAELADRLEPYLKQNALLGLHVRQEILAAIELYSIYFAKSRPAVEKALKKGLAALQAAADALPDRESAPSKLLSRFMLLSDGPNPQPEIRELQELIETMKQADFPMPAFVAYMQSRREFNEIRRIVRPYRRHDAKQMKFVAAQLRLAIAAARKSLSLLKGEALAGIAENVMDWQAYLEDSLIHTQPPQALCPCEPGTQVMQLFHDDCFRQGENFVQDFSGFFKRFNYIRPANIVMQVFHTGDELAITLREFGIDMDLRRQTWESDSGGSNSFCMRVFVDPWNKGETCSEYIVWPMGKGANAGRSPQTPIRTEYSYGDRSWQMTAWIPFSLIGRRPRKGHVWGLNVASNPANMRNYSYTWAPQYDGTNPGLFGKIKFQ